MSLLRFPSGKYRAHTLCLCQVGRGKGGCQSGSGRTTHSWHDGLSHAPVWTDMDVYQVIRHPGDEDEGARWVWRARQQRGPVEIASGPTPAVLRPASRPRPVLGESCTTSIKDFAIFPPRQKKKKRLKVNFSISTISEFVEQRSAIKFCLRDEISVAETFRMLQKAFGHFTMTQKNFYKCYKDFKKGRERVDDDHDNAPSHTALVLRNHFAKNSTHIVLQPPYSPDLAPCDFWPFSKLKRPLRGHHFDTIDPNRRRLWRQFRKSNSKSVSTIGKNVGISALYREGITLKGMKLIWINK